MLPSSANFGGPSHSIYINPDFNKSNIAKTTHINPNFLLSRSSAIHLNPYFLQKQLLDQQKILHQQGLLEDLHVQEKPVLTETTSENVAETSVSDIAFESTSCKVIPKSRMRLVRNPPQKVPQNTNTSYTMQNPMVKLGRRKLMRKNLLLSTPAAVALVNKVSRENVPISGVKGKYKIDRRRVQQMSPVELPTHKPSSLVLNRSSPNVNTYAKKNSLRTSKICQFKVSRISSNKNLQVLNINGILYNSTRTKLQRKDTSQSRRLSKIVKLIKSDSPNVTKDRKQKFGNARTVKVRGTRFVLDKNGYKLTRVSCARATEIDSVRSKKFNRIDIGGLTYVATSQNVFVRTGNHLVRSHVNNAKQRSLHVLTRNLAKSNVPCPIFQRVGKCSAYERGKCSKVHDRRQVDICSRFLRGECLNDNCLLSHNVSLAKMPVCKFFLQGICVRPDCSYLHKKVSRNTEICIDFLRGFCPLAEKCNKRHEFLCPDYERDGKCDKIKCIYCKKKQQVHKDIQKKSSNESFLREQSVNVNLENNVEEQEETVQRYFVSGCDNTKDQDRPTSPNSTAEENASETELNTSRPSRKKLGSLPAFIPLS